MNRCFVCITISRRYISFQYHQEGATMPLAPFPGEEPWPAPLALYCTPNRIEIGRAAERAAARGVSGAYKEWFRQLSSISTVNYLGQSQPINHLLLLATEEQLRRFLREVRFNVDGGLENCRSTLPLVISFEDDVDDSMRIFLLNLFKSMGYGNILETYHNHTVVAYYRNIGKTGSILIVDSDGVDLILSLYVKGRNEVKQKRVIADAGTDRRLPSVCNMIWDKTGAEYSFLDKSIEQPRLEQMATEILNANQIEYEGIMEYSNGDRLGFMVTRSELEASGSGVRSVAFEVERFLEKNMDGSDKDITIVLRNYAARSDYFSHALSSRFPTLTIHDEEAIDATNNIIVYQVMQWMDSNRTPKQTGLISTPSLETPLHSVRDKKRKWREVKALATGKSRSGNMEDALKILKNFKDKCQKIAGAEELLPEITSEIERLSRDGETHSPKVDSTLIKKLERQWREIKATANGKNRTGNNQEASSILQQFLDDVKKVHGTDNLVALVVTELSNIKSDSQKLSEQLHNFVVNHPNDKYAHGKSVFPSSSDRRQESTHNQTQSSQEHSHKDKDEGESLLAQGKYTEARDWFRSQNDTNMARILSDIIRSKKGIDLRKKSIDEYRKSKNQEQISRIINEIRGFITLCDKAGIDSTEYKTLLKEYYKFKHI